MDMRVPGGRGKDKQDGALQSMGMYSKDSAFSRVLKLQEAIYKVQGRIAKSAIAELKAKGINVGLVRPITVWPFPYDAVREAACQDSVKAVLDVELNEGQMLEDVKLAINGAKPIDFTGHCGSQMPTTDEIVEKILSMKEGK